MGDVDRRECDGGDAGDGGGDNDGADAGGGVLLVCRAPSKVLLNHSALLKRSRSLRDCGTAVIPGAKKKHHQKQHKKNMRRS